MSDSGRLHKWYGERWGVVEVTLAEFPTMTLWEKGVTTMDARLVELHDYLTRVLGFSEADALFVVERAREVGERAVVGVPCMAPVLKVLAEIRDALAGLGRKPVAARAVEVAPAESWRATPVVHEKVCDSQWDGAGLPPAGAGLPPAGASYSVVEIGVEDDPPAPPGASPPGEGDSGGSWRDRPAML